MNYISNSNLNAKCRYCMKNSITQTEYTYPEKILYYTENKLLILNITKYTFLQNVSYSFRLICAKYLFPCNTTNPKIVACSL